MLSLCSLGGLLLSGGRDNIIRVWDMDALVCRRTLAGHRDDVMCIAGLGLEPPPGAPADPSQPKDGECSQVRGIDVTLQSVQELAQFRFTTIL